MTNRTVNPFVIAFMLFLAFLIALSTAQGVHGAGGPTVTVTLPSRVELVSSQGAIVTLGQSATIEGVDRNLIERLKAVQLGTVPIKGSMRRVTRDYVILRMRQAKVDPKAVRFLGADTVELVGVAVAAGQANGPGLFATVKPSPVSAPGTTTAVVAKGQTVKVEVSSGPLTVTAKGKAQDGGVMGESIRILLDGSGKVVLGEIIGTGHVRIELD